MPCPGTAVATQIAAAEAGADIIDCCIDSMSGLTSQPNMGAIVNALAGTPLDTGIDPKQLLVLTNYWCVLSHMRKAPTKGCDSMWCVHA
jgi:pyruvate carboxylase